MAMASKTPLVSVEENSTRQAHFALAAFRDQAHIGVAFQASSPKTFTGSAQAGPIFFADVRHGTACKSTSTGIGDRPFPCLASSAMAVFLVRQT